MYSHILSIILFMLLVGALILLFVPKENTNAIRWLANIFAMLGFAVSLPLVPWFWAVKDQPGFKFLEGGVNNWIPTIGAGYSLGIDGISIPADHADHDAGGPSRSFLRGKRFRSA